MRPGCIVFLNNMPISDALNEFKLGRSHMAIVRSLPMGKTTSLTSSTSSSVMSVTLGVVTMHDVMENIVQTDINCERTFALSTKMPVYHGSSPL